MQERVGGFDANEWMSKAGDWEGRRDEYRLMAGRGGR